VRRNHGVNRRTQVQLCACHTGAKTPGFGKMDVELCHVRRFQHRGDGGMDLLSVNDIGGEQHVVNAETAQ
jgi:hypothetical protein